MRDSQRSKLYQAEDDVPWGDSLNELENTQAFVDKIVQGDYWARFDHAPRVLLVRDGRGRRHACMRKSYFGGELCLPRWARSPMIVLHELAHALDSSAEDSESADPFHGAAFARRYLDLVGFYMSLDSKAALQASFDQHGVDYDA